MEVRMIQLVIEGTEQFRKIISAGVEDMVYTLGKDQVIRLIDDWKGRIPDKVRNPR